MKRKEQRGVAAIELALMAGFLVMLGAGMVEFGHALYTYDTLAKQARAGARYLAIRENPAASAAADQARSIVLCGMPACSGSPVVPGLTLGQISTSVQSNVATGAATGSLDMVTITVSGYVFQPWIAIPFYGPVNVTFGPISVTMPRVS